jgi:outer membrane protease
MKNITALTILVITISVFSPNNYIHCQETEKRNYGFSIGLQSGFVRGQALEVVYPVPGETMGELLSELRWDMKNIYYLGIKMDIARIDTLSAPGFYSSLSFKAGLPADSGVIENRDWMSNENNALTHFSSHTNRTNQFFTLDAAIGISVPVNSFFFFRPFIGGSWMRFSFTGRDGHLKYARVKGFNAYFPIDDNPIIRQLEGELIRYEQNWLLITPGLSVGAKILQFSFDLSFRASMFTYCAATDEHIARRTIFKDYTRLGLFLEPGLSISYSIQRVEFSLEAAYRHIGRTRGLTYISENDGAYYVAANKAGAGLSILDTRFIVKLRI